MVTAEKVRPKHQRQLQLTVGIKSAQNRTNINNKCTQIYKCKPANLPQGATTTTKPKESTTPTKTPSISDLGYELVPVPGFKFPLQQRSDVECLENAIQNNKDIRNKYIAFLAQRKPKHMGIHKFISTVFSDEALNAYNLHGSNTSGRAKIPMKTYSVFYDCFIEAFESSGLNERELQSQLTAAIKHSRNRMRQRTFRARKSLVKNETTPGDKSE